MSACRPGLERSLPATGVARTAGLEALPKPSDGRAITLEPTVRGALRVERPVLLRRKRSLSRGGLADGLRGGGGVRRGGTAQTASVVRPNSGLRCRRPCVAPTASASVSRGRSDPISAETPLQTLLIGACSPRTHVTLGMVPFCDITVLGKGTEQRARKRGSPQSRTSNAQTRREKPLIGGTVLCGQHLGLVARQVGATQAVL